MYGRCNFTLAVMDDDDAIKAAKMLQTNRIPASVQLLFMNLFTSGIHAGLTPWTGVQRIVAYA